MLEGSRFAVATAVLCILMTPMAASAQSGSVLGSQLDDSWFEAIASDASDLEPGSRPDAAARQREATDESDSSRPAKAERRWGPVRMSEMIEQILTTARRRLEPVQRTPVAVTAIAGLELEDRDVRRMDDFDALAPSLSFDNAIGNANAGRISIRGVTAGDPNPATDPTVGVYIDGVYVPRAQGLIGGVYDLERAEILRGPQGTLFGKNTIGGSINIVTRRPTFDPSAQASVRIGNFHRVDTRATLNIPLVPERSAARFSIATNYDDGYQQNAFLDERLGNDRLLAGRAQFLLVPTEDIEILLSAEFARQDRRPIAGKCKVVGPVNPVVQGLLDQINLGRQAAMLPAVDLQGSCALDDQRSDFKIASDLTSAEDDLRTTRYTSDIRWALTDVLTLRSITSYRNQNNDLRQDLDAGELPIAEPLVDAGGSEQRSFSQELQLSGSLMNGRLDVVLGLYGFGESIDDRLIGGVFAGLAPGALPITEENLDVENRSYAAYGQATFAITDKLSVTAGLRRTVERKRIKKEEVTIDSSLAGPAGTALLPMGFERSDRFSDFSPAASISYEFTPEIFTYLSYSTGFRSGGFNGRVNSINRDFNDIDSEELTTYEAGFKTRFFADRLLVNGAVYFSVYEDIQRPIVTGGLNGVPTAIVRNAAEARLRGAELELVALPWPGLRLESAFSAFRSRYTDFDLFGNDVVASASSFASIEDAGLPAAPNYLFSVAATYQREFAPLGVLTTRVQWRHRGAQANDVADLEAIRSSKYGILDGHISLALPDGKTEISLFGTNLLDRIYTENGLNLSDTVGTAIRFLGPPRRYGLEVKRSF